MARRKRGAGKSDGSLPMLHLESYWPRLPAFRAVAEHENLQEASRVLKTSASSTSRTIRLLESELGVTLFSRAGGRLTLTAAGSELLESVRRAMRIVDDGAASIAGAEGRRPLRLALPRTLTSLIALPAMERHRGDVVHLRSDAESGGLASGLVDLAVVIGRPTAVRGIEIHALGALDFAVFCGRQHPVWERSPSTLDEIAQEPFVGATEDGVEDAVWPPERPRIIALHVTDASTLLEACRASIGLAILPVARATKDLRIVARLPPASLYGLRRAPIDDADRVTHLLASVREVIEQLSRV